jgi:tetratricopeptide (TPR) repeat protein
MQRKARSEERLRQPREAGPVEYNRAALAREINPLQDDRRDRSNGSAALFLYPKESTMMKRAYRTLSAFLFVFLIASACSSGGNDVADTQEKFGVRMAKMNLWREAMFRFKRAVEMDPSDAMAHNNLAVAYEANGDFDAAAKEYREAIRLDKSNQFIQKNYSRFVEFNTRNRRRQQPARPATSVAATPPATSTATESPAPAPATGDAGAPATPVSVSPTPSQPMAPAAAGGSDSPQPAATAPAAITPPNPPVVEPQPPQQTPPGVHA